MQYLMKRLMKYFNRSNPKTPYKQLVKVEKARPVRVHKGHVPIYVGEEEKIGYEVPLKYLSLPSFQELFVQSQPIEMDINIGGPIVLTCSTEVFEQLLSVAMASYRSSAR